MKLLTPDIANTKTAKNRSQGRFLSFILHLAPYTVSGYNTCKFASKGCADACLNTAGRGRFDNVKAARERKTKLFFENRTEFFKLLLKDLQAVERKAAKLKLKAVVRLNGTSDLPFDLIKVPGTAQNVFNMFPNIQFYDYTKDIVKVRRLANAPITNYHVTFSRSESNSEHCTEALSLGVNVAVVFSVMPNIYAGRPVTTGENSDLRFLDPTGHIIGLVAKGKAKKDCSGFVVQAG